MTMRVEKFDDKLITALRTIGFDVADDNSRPHDADLGLDLGRLVR
jgi:hypothetical protein